MANSLEKIIELIGKTGDRCIVLNHRGEPAYVILTLANYQSLVGGRPELSGLTEAELLERINRDIAAWKASQDENKLNHWETLTEIKKASKNSALADNQFVTNNQNQENLLNQAKNQGEEDQYYFEPIE